METGDVYELAWWCWDGGDTEAEATKMLTEALQRTFEDADWTHSPVQVAKVIPPHPRLTPPPSGVIGLNPFAVVAEATAVAPRTYKDLGEVWDSASLRDLRRSVRTVWASRNPGEVLDDDACDAMIEDMTPGVVRKILN